MFQYVKIGIDHTVTLLKTGHDGRILNCHRLAMILFFLLLWQGQDVKTKKYHGEDVKTSRDKKKDGEDVKTSKRTKKKQRKKKQKSDMDATHQSVVTLALVGLVCTRVRVGSTPGQVRFLFYSNI